MTTAILISNQMYLMMPFNRYKKCYNNRISLQKNKIFCTLTVKVSEIHRVPSLLADASFAVEQSRCAFEIEIYAKGKEIKKNIVRQVARPCNTMPKMIYHTFCFSLCVHFLCCSPGK